VSSIDIKIPKKVTVLSELFNKNGFEIYVVGGAVRDHLMGKPISDWDFTTNATPEEMLAFLPDSYYNNTFGTVGVPVDNDERPYEVTTFRHEKGYTDSRHPDSLEWGTSLEGDLERRDFTINAMAIKLNGAKAHEIIDPFNGQKDIKKKTVRAVGEAVERFREDALRMMRAIRIASELGFTIEEETFEAIKMHSSTIHRIAKERVREELFKTLASHNPYEGMMMLKNSALMDEVLPELAKTFGVDQKSPGRHHIHDVGTHCMLSLRHCPAADPLTRFATLIHDIGKPQTFKKNGKSGQITFYNHEVVGSRIAKNIANRLRFSKADSEKLFLLVRWHQFTLDERQTDKSIKRFIRNVGTQNIQSMLDLRVGDRLGGGAAETSWRLEEFKARLVEVQKQPFTVHDLKITGEDVMRELNLKPGPKVGEILKQLFEKVENKEVENTKEELFKSLKGFPA